MYQTPRTSPPGTADPRRLTTPRGDGLGDISARARRARRASPSPSPCSPRTSSAAPRRRRTARRTDEVLTHYADHRAITFVLVATFVLSGIGLAVFLGGSMRRLLASERRGWALTGFVGAIGIMALFAIVVGCRAGALGRRHRTSPNVGAIEALWALHNSVFTVLDLFIAAALLGLSRAGIAAGITPRAFDVSPQWARRCCSSVRWPDLRSPPATRCHCSVVAGIGFLDLAGLRRHDRHPSRAFAGGVVTAIDQSTDPVTIAATHVRADGAGVEPSRRRRLR